jgi:hypothetical protein
MYIHVVVSTYSRYELKRFTDIHLQVCVYVILDGVSRAGCQESLVEMFNTDSDTGNNSGDPL